MKYLVVLTFAVVAAIFIAISQGVSSSFGTKTMNDVLLHREFVLEKEHWWRKATRDYSYPPKGYYNMKTISAVYAIDKTGSTNTSTGYASLYKGGPGQKFVSLYLKSPNALNFTIEIYGDRH